MILLLGGTGDARELAAALRAAGYEVLVSTVSEYGARLAAGAAQRGRQLAGVARSSEEEDHVR